MAMGVTVDPLMSTYLVVTGLCRDEFLQGTANLVPVKSSEIPHALRGHPI